ncbi:hypothetical protein BD413DRAFT_441356, partial [Trametes elegans]
QTPDSPPPEPMLPPPSLSTPSPSFFCPNQWLPLLFASLMGRRRRRKKKLVISGAPLELGPSRALSRQCVQNTVKWCESFGPVRKIETKEDGSLHVYWKDWEVADMVCRVQADVVINVVGRVRLAWLYIS